MSPLAWSGLVDSLFTWSLLILPYASYLGILGLLGVITLLGVKTRNFALDITTSLLLGAIALLLLLSALVAVDRGEAFRQLSHFLPYFLLFALLPPLLTRQRLETVGLGLVIAAIPLNLMALGEYVLRSNALPTPLTQLPFVAWVRLRPHAGRAMVMFDHPNTLANYLVLILGLGLGLILYRTRQGKFNEAGRDRSLSLLLYGATFLNLVGIFSSGSRNGLLVGMSQIALVILCTRPNRILLGTGLIGLGAVLAGAAWFGIGGRSLNMATWSNDPRVGVWAFALTLVQQRPWLGWGLGNLKLQYPPGLIPGYDFIAHAHNVWLSLAVEVGIPAVILFSLLVGRILFRSVKRLLGRSLKPDESAILLAYLLAFWGCIAFAFFDVTFYDARINSLNWVILSALYSLGWTTCRTLTHQAHGYHSSYRN